jgi:aspartate ammonia-lyase
VEKNDPEMYKLMQAENDLDRRTHELARDYRDASKEGRAKLKADVKKLVTQQFEARQQRRTLQLKRLEDELQRFRDGMERREKDRQQIIEKRVSELLSEEAEAGF